VTKKKEVEGPKKAGLRPLKKDLGKEEEGRAQGWGGGKEVSGFLPKGSSSFIPTQEATIAKKGGARTRLWLKVDLARKEKGRTT